jgi:hypothetical protein
VSVHSASGHSCKDNQVTEATPDPERLASLLDGRLNEAQRAELLALLASSDEVLEAYMDAVAVTLELEETSAQPDVIPLRRNPRTRGWRWPDGRWLALAALVVGLALIPVLMNRRGAPDLRDPGQFVALLETERAGLPPGWNDRPWSTTRGAADPLTPRARAVRVGARLTDLELAVNAGDSAATALLAAEIAALLEDVPASGPLAALYRDVGRRAGQSPDQLNSLLEQGRDWVAQLLGEDYVSLGAWAEAARVAAARRDTEFFRSRTTAAALDRATSISTSGPAVVTSTGRIQAAIKAEGALDWGALEAELTKFLRVLAN